MTQMIYMYVPVSNLVQLLPYSFMCGTHAYIVLALLAEQQ